MAETVLETVETGDVDAGLKRVYEIGYHIVPTVAEENVEKVVGDIRAAIEKAGGTFIAEGAPALQRLAYEMTMREGDKNVDHDRGYFGWLKFESGSDGALALDTMLKESNSILRYIVFKTVREDTRAKMKAPTLREVKRTDTIRTTPRRTEEAAGPVSEADLDKALEDLTTE